MTTLTRKDPAHQVCQLPHHRPGARVAFHQWNTREQRMGYYTGRVVDHVGRRITIAVDPDGHHVTTECGHVTRAVKR